MSANMVDSFDLTADLIFLEQPTLNMINSQLMPNYIFISNSSEVKIKMIMYNACDWIRDNLASMHAYKTK